MLVVPALGDDLANTHGNAGNKLLNGADHAAANPVKDRLGLNTSASAAASADAPRSSHLAGIGSFSDFLTALNAGSLAAPISDVGTISNVKVVNIATAFSDFNANALHDALTTHDTAIAALRSKLDGNLESRELLLGNNVSISLIVGIETQQDGTLVIYIDGRN